MLNGISKGGFGAGMGGATPLMALTIFTAAAATLLLPLFIVSDLFAITNIVKLIPYFQFDPVHVGNTKSNC